MCRLVNLLQLVTRPRVTLLQLLLQLVTRPLMLLSARLFPHPLPPNSFGLPKTPTPLASDTPPLTSLPSQEAVAAASLANNGRRFHSPMRAVPQNLRSISDPIDCSGKHLEGGSKDRSTSSSPDRRCISPVVKSRRADEAVNSPEGAGFFFRVGSARSSISRHKEGAAIEERALETPMTVTGWVHRTRAMRGGHGPFSRSHDL